MLVLACSRYCLLFFSDRPGTIASVGQILIYYCTELFSRASVTSSWHRRPAPSCASGPVQAHAAFANTWAFFSNVWTWREHAAFAIYHANIFKLGIRRSSSVFSNDVSKTWACCHMSAFFSNAWTYFLFANFFKLVNNITVVKLFSILEHSFSNTWTYFCIPELFWICRQHVSNWWAFFVVVNIFFNPWFCLKTLTFFYFAKSFSICEHFMNLGLFSDFAHVHLLNSWTSYEFTMNIYGIHECFSNFLRTYFQFSNIFEFMNKYLSSELFLNTRTFFPVYLNISWIHRYFSKSHELISYSRRLFETKDILWIHCEHISNSHIIFESANNVWVREKNWVHELFQNSWRIHEHFWIRKLYSNSQKKIEYLNIFLEYLNIFWIRQRFLNLPWTHFVFADTF